MSDSVGDQRSYLRETPQDLKREAEILDALCHKFKCDWKKLGNGGKYRIDAVLHRGAVVDAFAEVKDYKTALHLYMNVPKYLEGMRIAEATQKPFLFIVRYQGKIGYIKAHGGGAWSDVQANVIMGGGTPPGRKPNPDDVEPLMQFNPMDIKWI